MSSKKSSGHFIWHDCLTGDIDQAIDFFAGLTQWKVWDQTTPNVGRYPILQSANGAIAGLLELPSFLQSSGVAPYWTGYVHTDLAQAAVVIPELGGQMFTMPTQSAMGTSFVFADPGGAILAAYEPASVFTVPSSNELNEIVWQRLYSGEADRSIAFYKTLFNWEAKNGSQKPICLQASAGETVGDISAKPSWVEADTWVYFIGVSDTPKAAAAVESAGGSIIEQTSVNNRPAIVTKDAQGGVIGFAEI